MKIIERIAEEIKEKIEKASAGKIIRPSILFCGWNPEVKKDMHKRAKRVGLNPTYKIKHPTIKVELKNNGTIETDKFKTISIDYEHFDFFLPILWALIIEREDIVLLISIDQKLEDLLKIMLVRMKQ